MVLAEWKSRAFHFRKKSTLSSMEKAFCIYEPAYWFRKCQFWDVHSSLQLLPAFLGFQLSAGNPPAVGLSPLDTPTSWHWQAASPKPTNRGYFLACCITELQNSLLRALCMLVEVGCEKAGDKFLRGWRGNWAQLSLGNVTLNAAPAEESQGWLLEPGEHSKRGQLDTYPVGFSCTLLVPFSLYSTSGHVLSGPVWTLTPWAIPGGGTGTVVALERLLSWWWWERTSHSWVPSVCSLTQCPQTDLICFKQLAEPSGECGWGPRLHCWPWKPAAEA